MQVQVQGAASGQGLAGARSQAGTVLLGTASWLLERVRRSSSTGGGEDEAPAEAFMPASTQ